jgi:hypothetical protein
MIQARDTDEALPGSTSSHAGSMHRAPAGVIAIGAHCAAPSFNANASHSPAQRCDTLARRVVLWGLGGGR